jgi:hypothetical protein
VSKCVIWKRWAAHAVLCWEPLMIGMTVEGTRMIGIILMSGKMKEVIHVSEREDLKGK